MPIVDGMGVIWLCTVEYPSTVSVHLPISLSPSGAALDAFWVLPPTKDVYARVGIGSIRLCGSRGPGGPETNSHDAIDSS